MIIETENLTKYYGKNRGIINLNLKVKEGDIFGFIGPNGAGKSTTIRLLLGLITPTSGCAKIFGKDCVKDKTVILADIGYMPSEAMFYGSMRVDEIIELSAKLHKKDCSAEAEKLCDRFQVDTKKKIDELSLGNRRKISIICAFQHNPKLCILDEPTSGLDPLMQKEFFNLLKERNQKGMTVFLSSHILSEVGRYCHNAGVVKEGELITVGTVEELTKSSIKRVTLHGVNSVAALDGMFDVISNDNHISFLYRGSMPALVNYLSSLPITDITITEPDLEESFMHFYGADNVERKYKKRSHAAY